MGLLSALGGAPVLLDVMYHKVNKILEAHGVRVARSLVGSYITSLEMAGTSVTLLKVDDEQLRLWDAP